MNKVFLSLFVSFIAVFALSAQVDGSAIGLRFNHTGAEISYQHPLSETNRIEADLGYNSWGLALTGVYQWVWDLSSVTDGLNCYAGAGISGGLKLSDNLPGIGVVGQFGVEYNLSIPLQISLDYRPACYLMPYYEYKFDGICLSARYRF